MILFLANTLLALAWVAITGSFTLLNLVFGFALGVLALALVRDEVAARGDYATRAWRVGVLLVVFLRELLKSAWRVAWIVTRPRIAVSPGIFAYPLRVESDFQIALLANLITLTPGTLSVDVSDDRRTLYVHALDVGDAEAARADIADGFERLILEAFAR